MGRKAEQNRLIHQGESVAVEQTSVYDDSLLPPAEELAKLQQLDPDCLNWIKKRTEIEQDARIQFNKDKVGLMHKDMNLVTFQNVLCVIVAFIIIMSGLACSAYFVYKGLKTEGSIFGGSTLVFAGLIFLKFRSKNDSNSKK